MNTPSHSLLALDIGTRKVAGLIVEPHARGMKVLAASVIEHPDRSMLDGQVHKIEAVAEVVGQVKHNLEAATGRTLTEAAVAAAGRALITEAAIFVRRFPFVREVTREDVLALELSAARSAQAALRARQEGQQFHCVGFSTVRFRLDGQDMEDLVGHQGRELSAEVLATFLPRQVVDSLMAVLRRAGLSATSLTLEPIAAIEATIPADLRRMNLALVDIGAGTSDIALTREGTVFAYAMVTEAGDEITEKLCEHYLLEFAEGERVKRLLETAGREIVEFTTLLGQKRRLPAEEMTHTLQGDVHNLAQAIAERILTLNGGAPKAVVMVGGGSATPGLGEALARQLGLDPQRVGGRGPDFIPDLFNSTGLLTGIEGVTPLGIALSGLRGRGLSFQKVLLNAQPVQLLSLHEGPTVFDALLAAGCEIQRLYARPGQAMTYTLNGRMHTLPGTTGVAASLTVNGKPAHLDTVVTREDQIEFREAADGKDAKLLPAQVPRPSGPAWCVVNGHHRDLELALTRDGRLVAEDEPLPDRANLAWVSNRTLAELLPELAGRPETPEEFMVRVNGEERRLQGVRWELTANGKPVEPDYRPLPDDRIEFKQTSGRLAIKDLVGDVTGPLRMTVLVNGQPRTLDYGGSRVLVNGRPANGEDLIPSDAEIVVESFSSQPPILSQILEGLPLNPPSDGGSLKLTVDGISAGFTTPLRDGARVEVSFG